MPNVLQKLIGNTRYDNLCSSYIQLQ